MINNIRKFGIALLGVGLIGCGGGESDNSAPLNPPPVQGEVYELSVLVRDANSRTALEGASVNVAGSLKSTNAQGMAYFDLKDGNYTVYSSMNGYIRNEKSILIDGQDRTLSFDLEEGMSAPEEGFVFHSDHDDSFYMQYWGDTWGSGAQITDIKDDPDFSKVLEIKSGTNWGFGAGIAWGNQFQNAIDTSSYTHVRFNLKPSGFANVEVNVQGFNITNFAATYAINSGTPLANGWYQFEVPIPTTTELKWLGLVFTGGEPSSVLLSNVSFITKDVQLSQPNQEAPAPTLSDNEAFSIFSDTLKEDKFVSLWNENWWNAPFYTPGSINGNNYARYEIVGAGAEGGVVGIQYGIEYGSVDVSMHDTWNLDLYVEPGIRKVQLQLVSTDGSATYVIDNPATEQWLSLEIPFSAMALNGDSTLNSAQMQMAGIQLWGDAGQAIFIDNFYFSGTSNSYDLEVSVIDQQGNPIANADVIVGVDGEYDEAYTVSTNASGLAVLNLSEGKQKVNAVADGYGIAQSVTTIDSSTNTLELALVPLNPGPTEAAPVPTVSSDDVISLFSDSLTSKHWITYWSDPWWNPPTHSNVLIEGNNTAKFVITPAGINGGVTGIQYGIEKPVDASAMTGLRFDFYATAGVTKAQFQLLSKSGPLIYDMTNVQHDQWVSVELSFDELGAPANYDKSQMQQLGMGLWGTTSDSVYLDNIYFY